MSLMCYIPNLTKNNLWNPGSVLSNIYPRALLWFASDSFISEMKPSNSVSFFSPKRSYFNAYIFPCLCIAWYINLCLHCKFSAVLPWFIQNLMFWSNYFDIKPVSTVKAEAASGVSLGHFLAQNLCGT